MPRARGRTWAQKKRDGSRTISVDRQGQAQSVAKEVDQHLREAESASRLRIAVELGLLRGERDDLDALGASRDRRAAEEDGEAKEVARLTPHDASQKASRSGRDAE